MILGMDDKALKISFIEEALQVIGEMEVSLLDLEQNPNQNEHVDGVFRAVHNIKGSARAVGFEELGLYCHELETELLAVKNGTKAVTKEVIGRLLSARDVIGAALAVYQKDLDAVFNFEVAAANTENSGAIEERNNPFISAPVGKLVIQEKPKFAGDSSVRVNLKNVDKLINAVGELVVLETVLRQQISEKSSPPLLKVLGQTGKIIREVQELSMSLRTVPVKPLIQKLQRVSRDAAAELDKTFNFHVSGDDLEIDKTILDTISDAMVHLVRNAVDHGIENSEERKKASKSPEGNLHLSLAHEGGKLLVRLNDDGKGLDRQRIIDKAIEKGLITSGENLTEKRIFDLIFEPGFSTKSQVTAVSGRGVGMDVVKTCVESISGQVEIFSDQGKGTQFVITLPLTVAIIEGMVVSTNKENFIIPFAQVSETVRIDDKELTKGTESGTLLRLRGQYLPVYSLTELLEGRKSEKKNGIGIITKSAGSHFIVHVDDVLRQQQIVVKQLGAELSGFKRFVGSGVLGDGKPALILDLTQLADEEINRKRA